MKSKIPLEFFNFFCLFKIIIVHEKKRSKFDSSRKEKIKTFWLLFGENKIFKIFDKKK